MTIMKHCMISATLVATLVAASIPAAAAELVHLVAPSAMTLTLYPGQTRALVRETREVALPAGESTLSFSWAASTVDPASATLTVEGASVGDAIRAAGQDKALGWRVNAPQATEGKATLTYFLEGLKWYPSYRLWLGADGTARLVAYLHLTNDSGLDLPPLQVQISAGGPGMIDQIGGEGTEPPVPTAYALAEPVAVANGETVVRQLLVAAAVPAQTRYLYQAERLNGAVERVLVLRLPEGLAGLPEGAMTIYSAEPDSLPLFNTKLSYQAGQELRVSLGAEPDLVVERKLMSTSRANFETDRFGRITGSDTSEEYTLSIRNRLECPVTLEVTETVLSTWELKNAPTPTLTDTSSVELDLPLAADQATELKFMLVKHSGTRIKR
jgi:hypothetical protein